MSEAIRLSTWVLAARPKTLTAALVPVVAGTALAQAELGNVRWELALWAVLSALFIQIGTNLFNDALDFEKGADTEERIGPVRVTSSGLIPVAWVWAGAFAAFALATILALPLVIAGGAPIVAIGLASLACGYLYTGGPFPLAYRGLGDLFVILFFGWVATAGTYLLQAGSIPPSALLLGTQIGSLASVLIAINNLRDRAGDEKVGKRTFAVRFGIQAARIEITFLLLAPFLLGAYWVVQERSLAFLLPGITIPWAASLGRDLWKTSPGPAYNAFLARSARIHLVFGLLVSLGLLL